MNEIERYLQVCGYAPDDLINIATQQPGHGFFATLVKVADAARQISLRPRIAHVWISANPVRAVEFGRGKADDVDRVAALWADLDVKEGGLPTMESAWRVIEEVSERIRARPVTIVLSGHGLQPRWRLDEPWPNDQLAVESVRDFGRLVQVSAERQGGNVDPVYDLPRIIRAPGTVNVKDPDNPITVQVQFPAANQEDRVALWALQDAFGEYLSPIMESVAVELPRAEDVDLGRGDRYARRVLEAELQTLVDSANMPKGARDGQGRSWEKIQADVAFKLAGVAKADWNSITEDQAHTAFVQAAPTDGGWTARDVEDKWHKQWARAKPKEPPVEKATQSVDPLEADTYVSPKGLPAAEEPQPVVAVGNWPVFAQTDKGYAARLARRYSDVLRYSPKLKSWLHYVDGRWIENELGGQWAAHQLTEELYELEGGQYDDTVEYQIGNRVTTERREFARWCEGQEANSKVEGAAKLLKASGVLNVELSEFESNPMLVNAANCAVDITTGETMEHAPELMMRKKLAVPYDRDAKCPEFEAFLAQALPNPELREFLARIVGYSLTGSTVQQVVFMHRGPTASGKSVFLRVLSAMMGEYGRPMPESLLLHKNTEAHPTGIAGLENCRVIFTDETPQGARWDESLLKRLTGETPITARGMHQDFRDFRLVAKAHIVTNHPPHVSSDEATHRRLRVMPWDVTVPIEERDEHLADRIVASELPGVLAWAVRGALQWQECHGLAEPADAAAARMRYFQEEDEFGQWLDECTTDTGANGFITPTMTLYQSYEAWATRRRIGKLLTFAGFARELPKRGKVQGRTAKANGYRMALNAALDSSDPLEERRW